MINIKEEYLKLRRDCLYSAKDAFTVARNRALTELEKRIRGFSIEKDGDLNNGYALSAVLDGEEYEVTVEYDNDDNPFDWGEAKTQDSRPNSGKYAREQVIESGNRRNRAWIVLDEGPKERAEWYHKKGYSRGVAYEMGAKSCLDSLGWYKRVYEDGTDTYYVRVEKGGEEIDACSGVESESVGDWVWEAIS